MKMYQILFLGRTKGAIGVTYRIEKSVDAESAEAARMKLYETHEHILVISCEEVKTK